MKKLMLTLCLTGLFAAAAAANTLPNEQAPDDGGSGGPCGPHFNAENEAPHPCRNDAESDSQGDDGGGLFGVLDAIYELLTGR